MKSFKATVNVKLKDTIKDIKAQTLEQAVHSLMPVQNLKCKAGNTYSIEFDAKDKNEANNGGSGATSSVNFIAPISGYKITTGLYYSDGRYHGAVDYSGAGIYGKPVKAVADGIVIEAKELNYSYGRYVIIKHFNGLYTLYAHGSALNVKYGQEVKQGQTILYVGSSGNSTGPHLHFEVRTSSSYSSRVNPRNYLP